MNLMKFCTKCGTQCIDEANVCTNCGYAFAAPQVTVTDPKDHTAEYDAKDISDNKVIAMLPYLMGAVGLIIAILMANTSKYVQFHVRTALKYMVVNTILTLIMAVLCWTVIVPIVGAVAMVVLLVLQIISFIQVCQGKAKDPAIISSLKFLK